MDVLLQNDARDFRAADRSNGVYVATGSELATLTARRCLMIAFPSGVVAARAGRGMSQRSRKYHAVSTLRQSLED